MKPTPKTIFFWFALLCLSPFMTKAQPALTLDGKDNLTIDLGKVSIFEDEYSAWTSGSFLPQNRSGIIQNRYEIADSSQIKSKSSFWLEIAVENNSSELYKGVLLTEGLDIAHLYSIVGNEITDSTKSGRFTPFSQKELNEGTHRETKLPFEIPARTSGKLLIRVQNPSGVSIKLANWQIRQYNNWEQSAYSKHKKQSRALGIILGFMGIMFIYNLFIFFFSKERIYLLYSLYILFPLLYFQTILGGFNNSFIGENFTIYLYFRTILPSLTMVVYIQFIRLFLDTRAEFPKWDRAFRVLIFAEVACAVYLLIVVPTHNDFLTRIIPVLVHAAVQISSLSLLIYLVVKGNKSKVARYFVVGTGLFFGGALFYIAIIIGNFASLETGLAVMTLGIAGEIITYSLGLGHRIRTIEKARRLAQEENAKILANQNKVLEQKVLERTMALDQQKEEILTQNEELQQQNEEIVSQRDYISSQNKELSQKNVQITDSIRYAQTIQEAILPFESKLTEAFPNGYFAIYHPKDIVSGDIYWFEKVGNTKFLAVVDCTGHGVPGAFMSMIATSVLNDEIVKNGMKNPSNILEGMHQTLKKILNQDEKGSNQDGMDVAFCAIEENGENVQVTFAGAKRPLYYMLAGANHLQEIKGSRRSIGGFQGSEKAFLNHKISLPKNSTFYLTTDGMADQHGPKGKKIGSLHVREYLEEIAHLPMKAQHEKMEWFLKSHQKQQFQRDDITFVGVRI